MAPANRETVYENLGVSPLTREGIRPGGLRLTERAVEFCGFERDARILDIGSGNGATIHYLRTAHDLVAIGLDYSPALAREAMRRCEDAPVSVGAGNRLPFGDGVFDGIFMECSLSLMSGRCEVLGECHRVTRSDGLIVVSDVQVGSPSALDNVRASLGKSCLATAGTAWEAQDLVEDAGFQIELWEDHSRLLRDFAVRIIWELGSMSAFWGWNADDRLAPGSIEEAVRRSNPGYFLLIGRKKQRDD